MITQRVLAIILFLSTSLAAFGQKSDDLKTVRNNLKKDIEKTATEIKTTSKKRQSTLQQYQSLKRTVGSKKEMIKSLEADIEQLDIRIARQTNLVHDLQADMELLKDNYSVLLRKVYRQNYYNNQLLFLISANDFNDFIRRWRFLKHFHQYKKKQASLVQKTQKAFEAQNIILQTLKAEKGSIIAHIKDETKKLGVKIKQKEQAVKQLSQAEQTLKIKLAKQEKAKNQLNSDIESAIIAESKERRAKNRTSSGLSNRNSTKRDAELTKAFRNEKGKLSKPVSGQIVGKFGIRVHREANNTKTESPGIDIKTTANSSVYSVFDGTVIRVFYKPEFQNIVLVKHGEYFTLYSNLKSTFVKKGEVVEKGDILGKVGTKNGKTELHFQIWENGTKLNPEKWF
jgi:septal ring factor EnvC (AmiA/AmiB activator)